MSLEQSKLVHPANHPRISRAFVYEESYHMEKGRYEDGIRYAKIGDSRIVIDYNTDKPGCSRMNLDSKNVIGIQNILKQLDKDRIHLIPRLPNGVEAIEEISHPAVGIPENAVRIFRDSLDSSFLDVWVIDFCWLQGQ